MENTSEKVLRPIPPYTVLTETLYEMKQQLDVIKSIAVFRFHELIPHVLKIQAQTDDFIQLVNSQTDKEEHQEEEKKVNIEEEVIEIEEEVDEEVDKEEDKEDTTDLLGEDSVEEEQQVIISSRPRKKSKASRNIVIKVSNHQYVPKVLHPHMIVTYKVDT